MSGLFIADVESSLGARAKYHQNLPNPFPHCPPIQQDDDSMLLDDTKHTTYIHDLDRELTESDSTPGALILMPLAERLLTVPESVLSDDHQNASQGKELVLYTEPSSLSVPREQDSVRRAIIESRARTRALKSQQFAHSDKTSVPISLHTDTTSDITNGFDDDPMDIDGDS